eukprot:6775122-Prymnesium_polylepis.1
MLQSPPRCAKGILSLSRPTAMHACTDPTVPPPLAHFGPPSAYLAPLDRARRPGALWQAGRPPGRPAARERRAL